MTREQKLALIIGFSLVLLVGVLVSDHLSGARSAQLADVGSVLEEAAPPPLRAVLPETGVRDLTPREIPVGTLAATPEPANPQLAQAKAAEDPSLYDTLREQFREAPTPVAAKVDPAPTETASAPRVADPLVADQRPAAVAHYRVRPGDSLWSIAEDHYGRSALALRLAEYNVAHGRLRDPDTIRVGATLLLPEPRVLDASLAAAPPTKEPKARTYTVKRGDTLGEIAQRELGSARRTAALLNANAGVLDDPDDLRVGMVLRLPS